MRFTKEEVKQAIRDEIANIDTIGESDRFLEELADSLPSVYYHEIATEWNDLPLEAKNRFSELWEGAVETVWELMTVDLYLYYQSLVAECWDEVLEELAEQNTPWPLS